MNDNKLPSTETALAQTTIANRYLVDKEIGRGGMGIVYRVRDQLSDDVIALKRMSVSLRNTAEKILKNKRDTLFSLAREFRSVASLYHPNIVSVFDYGIDQDQHPYLTMQLVEQPQPITVYARDRSFSERVELLLQLLQGIKYLHRCNVIHRDIKPENVLVDTQGNVKITDFGLAINHTLSLSGQESGISGTIAYLAPEIFQQIQGNTIQSDLFAVGLIAYELFAGQYPFPRMNAATLLYSLVEDTPDTSMLDTGLADVINKAMKKHPDDRFATAHEMMVALCEAVARPLPTEDTHLQDSFITSSQFIGREEELQVLKIALDNILIGASHVLEGKLATVDDATGSAWLIGGEVGVGKSRLVDELRIRGTMRGALVLKGQGTVNGRIPYEFWREPLRKLALAHQLDPHTAGILKSIVPDIDSLGDTTIESVTALSSSDHQDRLQNAIVSAFKQIKRPLVLILEDLHWADESLNPLKVLTKLVETLPLLIIGTYRTDERPTLPDDLPMMHTIKLERFTAAEVEALSVSMLGESVKDSALVTYLNDEAEGNAFFIVEIVRELARTEGNLSNIGYATLPRSIFAGGMRNIIRRRLDAVPEWGRDLLDLVALIGRYVDIQLIQTLTTQYPHLLQENQLTWSVSHWLIFCDDANVLEVVEGQWQFVHDKLREALIQEISIEAMPDMYGMLATAMETTYAGDPTRALSILSCWHHAQNLDRELHYLMVIAESGVPFIGDVKQRQIVFQRGLSQLPPQDIRRVPLLHYLSESYWRTDYHHGERLAEQALAIAVHHDDRRAIARSYTIMGLMVRDLGRYDEAKSYHMQSLELYKVLGDKMGWADNLCNLGIIAHDLSQFFVARDYYEQSLKLYRELDQPAKQGMVLVYLGVLAYSTKEYALAADTIKQGLSIAEAIGNKRGASLALNNLAMTMIRLGDYEAAQTYFHRSLAIDNEIQNDWGIANTHINLGFMHLEADDLTQAHIKLHTGIALAYQIDALNLILEALIGIASVRMADDDLDAGLRLIGLVMAHPQANDDVRTRFDTFMEQLPDAVTETHVNVAIVNGHSLDFELELLSTLQTAHLL